MLGCSQCTIWMCDESCDQSRMKTGQQEMHQRKQSTTRAVNTLLAMSRVAPVAKVSWWIFLGVGACVAYWIWAAGGVAWWMLIPSSLVFFAFLRLLYRWRKNRQLAKFNQIHLPPQILSAFRQQYPALAPKQVDLIEQGLLDFIAMHLLSKRDYAMPSHAVDALWHCMLEQPKLYQQWCMSVLGYSLEHVPHIPIHAEQRLGAQWRLKSLHSRQNHLAWQESCYLHGLNPYRTKQLPRLYAIDAALGWADGQHYDVQVLREKYALKEGATASSSVDDHSGNHSCSSCSSCSSSCD